MDFNLLARVGKAVALLGFFLPWVTVSCSGTQLAEATGWQLMTGDIQASGSAAGNAQFDDPEPAIAVIAVFAIIAIGLLIGLLTRGRAAATTMLIAAIAAIALSFFSIENMRTGLREEAARSSAEADAPNIGGAQIFSRDQMQSMSRQVAQSIEIEKKDGFWITVIALIAAAVCALLTLARAPAVVRPPPP